MSKRLGGSPYPSGAWASLALTLLALPIPALADEGGAVRLQMTDKLNRLAPVTAREDIIVTLPTGRATMPIAPRNEKLRLSEELGEPAAQGIDVAGRAAAKSEQPALEPGQLTQVGGTLASLLDWLDRRSPDLQVLVLEAEAARERIEPAGALPDPMFSLELRDIAVDDPTGGAASVRYQLRQTFPLWGKRELRSQVASAGVQSAEARRDQLHRELRARLKTAYSQYVAAHQAQRVNQELSTLLKDLGQIVRVRYEMGLAQQQDALKVQAELSLLANDLVAVEAERRRATARINRLLARPIGAPLAPPVRFQTIPDGELAVTKLRAVLLEKNPRLAEAVADLDVRRHDQALVEKNQYPDLTVAVAPIQSGGSFKMWEMMFEVNVPLQQETRRAQEREAAASTRAAEARREALENELLGEFGELVAAFEASRHHCHLMRHTLLPQVELTLQSALAGYQNGKVDFTTLLDAHRQIRRAQLDLIRAEYESYVWLVELERLVGEDL